ncbi:DUF3850 domain-containing protein [Microbacterium sp. NPDC087589]|uniref:DUF3850 domain-containing protein n=1 Tax=Microbacterium sp. NPDC087589 TaxID=3364191 RepID=UPI003827651A
MQHELKSWPAFFGPIAAGVRTHELRRNDRCFSVGDSLLLREYDPDKGEYTGAQQLVHVTSLTSAEVPCAVSAGGLHPDFCILSIALGAA